MSAAIIAAVFVFLPLSHSVLHHTCRFSPPRYLGTRLAWRLLCLKFSPFITGSTSVTTMQGAR